jgi:GTP-binding protein
VVNKTDGIDADVAMGDFYGLGLVGMPRPIAASHGRGVSQLMEDVLEPFPEVEGFGDETEGGIRIGVVGRPNVGKSTLVNRMLGEDRVVVYDEAGTTRDSIYIPYRRNDKPYTLIDTAGVRRRGKVKETVEKFSIVKTLQAIKDAHVVVLVVDAHEGLTEQDMHLLGFVLDAGRALVIAVNKWDGMTADDKAHVKHELETRLEFAKFARIHFISALHGTAVGDLYKSVEEAHGCAFTKWSTNKLTTLLEDALQDHQPPLVHGRRIKLRYAHLGGSNPPLFIVHGNQTNALPMAYKRYLENKFIKVLKIRGTPVRFEFRTSDNPFEGKKNQLSARQITKKQRLVKHVKKANKKAKHK